MCQWESRLRLLIVRGVILGAFLILSVQLWQIQIVQGQYYQQRADRQRFSVERIDAPRGIFYDRNRQPLVHNVPKYMVSVVAAHLPATPEARQPLLERLSSLLGIPVSDAEPCPPEAPGETSGAGQAGARGSLQGLLAEAERRPYDPYPLAVNVDRQLAAVVAQELPLLPGVTVQVEPTRQYVDGSSFSHLLGYMWRMPAEDVQAYLDTPNSNYSQNDMVGYSGLERTMESELRGRPGIRHLETDAYGRQVAVLGVEPAEPGHSLVLTLDRDLQLQSEQILRQGMVAAKGQSAVAIVMSVRTGEVLSMVALPGYDNNLFAEGRADSYTPLLSDPSQPMFNRAIAGQYPPGSTFKIIPATAGLQEKVITRDTTLTCEGTMYIEAQAGIKWPFYCWIRKYQWNHGDLNVVSALAQSCDIFFYKLGGGFEGFRGLGLDNLSRYAMLFGLGEPTGIDLLGEARGLVPTSKYKRLNYGEAWTTGDTYNATIGQGYVLATPLQMVNALTIVANGGTLYRPQVIREIVDADGKVVRPFQPKIIRKLDVSPTVFATVREGLRRAMLEGGTAPLAEIPEVGVAGKTGSAEFGEADAKGDRPTHAWFIGYAPYDNPEVAIVVFVEGGGEGSGVAAPIAGQILRSYFGLPTIVAPAAQ